MTVDFRFMINLREVWDRAGIEVHVYAIYSTEQIWLD